MATHFLPLSKNVSCTSTPQGKHLCQISWELVKNWGSSSRRKIFPPFLPYAVTMATLFLSLSKNVSCTSTLQGKHLCQISWELVKNWGSSSRRKIGNRPPDRPTTRWFLYTPLIHYVYAARPTTRPPDDTLIPIYPPYTLRVCGGIINVCCLQQYLITKVH